MSLAPALAQIFRQMGYTWSTADELTNAVESLGIRGARSDDVAASLLAWRRAGVSNALGMARSRARAVLRGDGTNHDMENVLGGVIHDSDVEGQIGLFDTLDERNRAAAARCPMKDGK